MHLRFPPYNNEPMCNSFKQEEEPYAHGHVYDNFQATLNSLSTSLTFSLLERITTRFEFDSYIEMGEFFDEINIQFTYLTPEYNIFYSSYRTQLFRKVESELFRKGYYCNLSLEKHGRLEHNKKDRIKYQTRVIKPISMQKIVLSCVMMVIMFYLSIVMYSNNVKMPKFVKV